MSTVKNLNDLEDLTVWKRSFKDIDCLNTVDIVNLYSTLSVIIVENALKFEKYNLKITSKID